MISSICGTAPTEGLLNIRVPKSTPQIIGMCELCAIMTTATTCRKPSCPHFLLGSVSSHELSFPTAQSARADHRSPNCLACGLKRRDSRRSAPELAQYVRMDIYIYMEFRVSSITNFLRYNGCHEYGTCLYEVRLFSPLQFLKAGKYNKQTRGMLMLLAAQCTPADAH